MKSQIEMKATNRSDESGNSPHEVVRFETVAIGVEAIRQDYCPRQTGHTVEFVNGIWTWQSLGILYKKCIVFRAKAEGAL